MDDDRTVRVPSRPARGDDPSWDADASDSFVDADATIVVRRPPPAPASPIRARRSVAPLAIGGAVAIVALVVSFYLLLRQPASPPPEPAPPARVAVPLPPLAWLRTVPSDDEQRVTAGDTIAFEAEPDAPANTPAPVWTLDDREVSRGSTLRLATTLADVGTTRELVATVTRSGERLERRWRVVVAAGNRPPAIVIATPASGPLTVATGEKRRFEVSASDPDASDALTYTWEQDGHEMAHGAEATWTLEAAAAGETQVRVIVHDAAGAAAEPVVWQVSVRGKPNAPPKVVSRTPSGDQPLRLAVGDAIDLRVQVRDPNPDDRLAYRWLVDGREAGRQARLRFVAPEPVDAPHTIEVEVSDQARANAPVVRWTVHVTPKLRQVEAVDWVERLRAAWERKDVPTLRLYGVVAGEAEASATRRRLARYDAYRVQVSEVSAKVDGPYATVSFTRTDSGDGKVVSTTRETHELEKHANGSVTLKGRGWR
jgi:hypothetical protein